MSCATEGRPEHGTKRSHPGCSPLTVAIGWEYYKNINEQDMRINFDFDELFSSYEFSVNKTSCDLYFWGIKK